MGLDFLTYPLTKTRLDELFTSLKAVLPLRSLYDCLPTEKTVVIALPSFLMLFILCYTRPHALQGFAQVFPVQPLSLSAQSLSERCTVLLRSYMKLLYNLVWLPLGCHLVYRGVCIRSFFFLPRELKVMNNTPMRCAIIYKKYNYLIQKKIKSYS